MPTYLLLTIALIPLLNSLSASYLKSLPQVDFINKFLAILSTAVLIGIYQKLGVEGFSMVIMPIFSNVSFGFLLDYNALSFLLLLNFIWIILAFYGSRLFEIVEFEEAQSFQLFFNLNIAGVTLLLISKNLLTALVFYDFIIVSSLFFAIKFLYKKEDYFSNFFIFLFYLKSLLIFLAVILTYKFIGKLDFVSGNLNSPSSGFKIDLLLISTYLTAFFFFLIAPFYQIYSRNINSDMAVIYNFFLLPFAFAGLFIFTRVLSFIIGLENFGNLIDKIGFISVELIFLLAITISSVFLIFSKSLKSSFFHLFFQRFIFALFALLFFAKFDATRIYLPIYGFILEFTLIFLTLSSLNAYFTNSEEGEFLGIFYKMPITCGLLAFGFLSMVGLAPTTGMLEKFLILKIIVSEHLWLSLVLIIFSSGPLLFFFIKSYHFVFLRSDEEAEEDELAKDIDFDSNLILSALTVAIMLFSLFIINFFYHL